MVVGACSSMMLTEVSVNPKVVTSADSVVSFGASEVALAVVCSDNRFSHKHNYILSNFYNPGLYVKKVSFLQTHNQGLRQLFLTVSWDFWAKHDGVLFFS